MEHSGPPFRYWSYLDLGIRDFKLRTIFLGFIGVTFVAGRLKCLFVEIALPYFKDAAH